MFMSPTVLSLFIEIKPMTPVMFYSCNAVSFISQLRDKLFDKGRFPAIRFTYNR